MINLSGGDKIISFSKIIVVKLIILTQGCFLISSVSVSQPLWRELFRSVQQKKNIFPIILLLFFVFKLRYKHI